MLYVYSILYVYTTIYVYTTVCLLYSLCPHTLAVYTMLMHIYKQPVRLQYIAPETSVACTAKEEFKYIEKYIQ